MTLDSIKQSIKQTPFFECEDGLLYCADCMDILPQLPEGCVDLCWTDPPYNVGKDYGTYKDDMPEEEYRNWCKKWMRRIWEASNEQIVLFAPTKHKLFFWWLLGERAKEIQLTYSPAGAIKWGYQNQFSSLLALKRPVKMIPNVWHNCQSTGLGYFFKEKHYEHPGYTSEDICKRVVDGFSLTGNIILDPFMGTGSTAVVCRKMGRKWIGCEIDEKWCRIAVSRIQAEQKGITVKELKRGQKVLF